MLIVITQWISKWTDLVEVAVLYFVEILFIEFPQSPHKILSIGSLEEGTMQLYACLNGGTFLRQARVLEEFYLSAFDTFQLVVISSETLKSTSAG